MAGALPPVVAELLASNDQFMRKMAEAKGAMKDVSDTGSSKFSNLSSVAGKALGALGIGAAAVGVASVKMGADFQRSMTLLQTGAGESQKNIKMVSDGILNMAGAVGQTPQALAAGMFLIESAGYHGAAGLKVLKSAAEGAAVGGAQMSTVADALTTAMHDYNIPADHANQVTSALIQTVADGKTHLEDLASSLGKVMPVASHLGVSFQDVTGAMAAMTNSGLSARFAAMHLQNTLLAMSGSTATTTKALASVGLSSQQVKNTLDGPGGLSAALQLIETHVNSTFPAGSIQSVNALKAIMGGVTGYSTALMLTGSSSKTFETNVKNIGDTLNGAGGQVQGFSQTQKDLSFQVDQARATVEALGTKLGIALIPKLEEAAKGAMDVVQWFERNKTAAEVLAGTFGVLATAVAGALAVNKVRSWANEIKDAIKWVTNLGKASVITGGEMSTMGAEAATAGAEEATMGTEASVAAGEETAAGGAVARAGAGGLVAGEAAGAAGGASIAGLSAVAVPVAAAVAATLVGNHYFEKAFPGGIGGKGLNASSVAKQGDYSVQGVTQILQQQTGGILDKGEIAKIVAVMEKNGMILAQTRAQGEAAAKDRTVNAQMSVLNQMRAQLAADSAKHGATSAQAHADALALSSTLAKWGLGQETNLKTINASVKSSFDELLKLNAKQSKLETSGDGNLEESKYIKAVLEDQLSNAKSILSKDETAKASKQAIDLARQKVTDTETAVRSAQTHIDMLKSVADQITKTKDVIASQQAVVEALGKVNSDTTSITKVLGSGIPITKMPAQSGKMNGRLAATLTVL